MRTPKAAKKIWQYKHQLGGYKNGGALDTTLEQLSKILLKDLHQYTYVDCQLKLPEPDEFIKTYWFRGLVICQLLFFVLIVLHTLIQCR